MAIITTINYIHNFLKNDVVLEYLYSICNDGHQIQKRILNLPLGSCKKEYIDYKLFTLEQNYMTKSRSSCFWESHKQFIDIQLHLAGIEQMEFTNICNLEILELYNENKDLILYKDNSYSNKIVMQRNDIAIFFPEDAHLGMAIYDEISSNIFKTVVKYPLELWK